MGKFELPLDFLRNDSSIDPPSKPPIDRSRTDDPFDRAHPSRGRDARITALIAYVLGDENRARGGGVGERERGHFPSVTCVDERDVRACLPIAPARARESSFVPSFVPSGCLATRDSMYISDPCILVNVSLNKHHFTNTHANRVGVPPSRPSTDRQTDARGRL